MKRSSHGILSVAKSKDGLWEVSGPGLGDGKPFATKTAAVRAARMIARQDGGVVTVRNANGRVDKSFTLGRVAMMKLNAVEGVVLGTAGQTAFEDFDRIGATSAQRRVALRKELSRLAVGLKSPSSGGGVRSR